MKILVVNLGGTSGKLSVYEDLECIHEMDYAYDEHELALDLPGAQDVRNRADKILAWLESIGMTMDDFDVIAPRLGATFYAGDGGTFKVEGELRKTIESKYDPELPLMHVLFGTLEVVDLLLEETEKELPIYVTDPEAMNQVIPEALITGLPGTKKRVSFHASSQRAAARKAAAELGKDYREINAIVAHMGGGLSIGAHLHGRIVDVTDSTGAGGGPFSAKRAGEVPSGEIIRLCFSGDYTEEQMYHLVRNEAGLEGYLGTADLRVIEKRIAEGDEYAELIFNALAYQISREIGACSATLYGSVDAICFTGGMAHSKKLMDKIHERVGRIAPFFNYAGDLENEAVASGAYRVMTGQEKPAVYHPDEEWKNASTRGQA